jgi:histidinol-phosphatase (PHP family)
MIYTDLHNHSCFCDGKDTPEDIILSAIDKGLKTIGVCVHCFTDFEQSYCVSREGEEQFKKLMRHLKQKYADKIEIKTGIEQDILATYEPEGYDYIIGSSHFFSFGKEWYHVDYKKDYFVDVINKKFGGDYYSAVEHYYENVSKIVEKTHPDIIAHFDLINKFNEGNCLFDTAHPRYKRASESAIDALVGYKIPFEINTGAISRGYRSEPYPEKSVYEKIKERGGKFVLSSDSHAKANVAYEFSKWKNLIGE